MSTKRLSAFLTVEPEGRLKTKLYFDFDYCEIHEMTLEFYGVVNGPPPDDEWSMEDAIKNNEVGDIIHYDKDWEWLSIGCSSILSLRIEESKQ